MKQFPDYKKPYNSLWSFTLVSIFLSIFLIVPAIYSYAQTASELEDKIDQKSRDIEKLEKEIKQYQVQLDTLGKQKSSLSGSIQELDITKKKLNADISVTEDKIDKTNLKIQGLSSQIVNKEDSIGSATAAIELDIKKPNELEQASFVATILSENDFTLIWNDIDNRATVRDSIRDNVKKLRVVKGELEDTRQSTIDAKAELTFLRSKLADQKKIVEQNTKEKNTLLTQTKNSEANYQKLLAMDTAKKIAFEQEIRNYESQLKFVLNPSSLPSGRILSWPLDYVFITSPYGPRGSGFHGGTDFRAPVGTPVKTVSDGVVLGTGNTDLSCPKASFGQWILIQHNNGLSSTYAHLSLIKVTKGERVSTGQIIGYSGNTGSSTGPHLHLSLYASEDAEGNPAVSVKSIPSKSCLGKILTQPIAATNAYLDPMKYLPQL